MPLDRNTNFALFVLALVMIASPATAEPPTEPALFLNPPQIITAPGPEYAGSTRKFQGIPSLARSPQGRLWAVWYGGTGSGEDQHNYVILVTSGDDGVTWSTETLVVDPDGDGPVRAFDPEIWLDPTGRLWLFWAQAVGHDGTIAGVWAIHTSEPDKEKPTWSKPSRLTDGIMMCKPTVLSTGEWVLPASTWRKTDRSARMVVSTDEGKIWTVRGAANVPVAMRSFDEHHIVERKDGSLWMLVRVTHPNIGTSISTDAGRTWPEVTPNGLPHTNARFFISRLASGNLLMVKHADEVKGRSHLTAYLSTDDGQSWQGGLLLDERSGVSYPDGVQAEDGSIYIVYDYQRTKDKQILLAVFTEADILAKQPDSKTARLRVLVNQAK